MTLLIPLLLRLTALFERGAPAEETAADPQLSPEELSAITPAKE